MTPEKCPLCEGTGRGEEPAPYGPHSVYQCARCEGTGLVERDRPFGPWGCELATLMFLVLMFVGCLGLWTPAWGQFR